MKPILLGISLVTLCLFSPYLSSGEDLFDSTASDEFFQKGINAYYQQQYDPAIEAFKQAIAINPDNVKAHYYLGYTHYELGHFQKALRYFETAYEINHGYTPIPSDTSTTLLSSSPLGP